MFNVIPLHVTLGKYNTLYYMAIQLDHISSCISDIDCRVIFFTLDWFHWWICFWNFNFPFFFLGIIKLQIPTLKAIFVPRLGFVCTQVTHINATVPIIYIVCNKLHHGEWLHLNERKHVRVQYKRRSARWIFSKWFINSLNYMYFSCIV